MGVWGPLVIHKPSFDTILMVEKTLIESNDYPTRTQLWNRLPKRVHYSTYKKVLEYLEASNKIEFNSKTIIYLGVSDKLKDYISSLVELE
jgi:hypothetical protein